MYISLTLSSLALSSIASAGSSIKLPSSQLPISGLLDLPMGPICPLEDIFHSSESHQHSDTHTHAHSHSHQIQILRSNSTSPTTKLQSQPEPWTHHPICSENTTSHFCVFTALNFYGERGISIVTRPLTARRMSRLKAFSSPASAMLPENDTRDQPFTVEDLPGRGKGMIANRTIERGDLIKAHPAIAIFHNDAVDKSSSEYPSYAPLMKQAVDQLPSNSRNLFLSMAAHNDTEEPYIERIYTNTFGEDFSSEEHSIVIPETARLNHDCRPNAMYYFDHNTLMHYTHAARTIHAGEEITITYVDPLQTRLTRRKAIKRSWGFDCSCSLCSQSPRFVRESNFRIQQINALNKQFSKTNHKEGRVQGTVEMAEALVGLYEQERLYASVAEAYRVLALSYSARGRRWEALKWGSRAVEWGLIHDGPAEPDVGDMMKLVDRVEGHWSWKLNVRKEVDGERREEV